MWLSEFNIKASLYKSHLWLPSFFFSSLSSPPTPSPFFLNYSRGGLVSISLQRAIYKAISKIKLKGKWQKALSSGTRQDWLIWRSQANVLDYCEWMRKGKTPGTWSLHLYLLHALSSRRQTSNSHLITDIKIYERHCLTKNVYLNWKLPYIGGHEEEPFLFSSVNLFNMILHTRTEHP